MFFTTASSGDLRPSFFEMFAQERLVTSLRPAVRFVVEVLAVRQPALFRILPRADELFMLLHFLLEVRSLKRFNGTVAEVFYSMRRSSRDGGFDQKTADQGALQRRRIASSLLFVVFLPYLKEKLDNKYEQAAGGSASRLLRSTTIASGEQRQALASDGETATFTSLLRSFLMKIYPFLSSAYDLSHFVYNLGYLLERNVYFSPFLHIQKLIIRRQSVREMQGALEAIKPKDRSTPLRVFDKCLTILKYGLIVGVFAFKALEYYYRVEGQSTTGGSALILRPPEPLPPAKSPDASLPSARNICPLCRKTRTNPAACVVSGYVFCFPCLFEYIQRRARCPVTLISATTEDIRRIYEGE